MSKFSKAPGGRDSTPKGPSIQEEAFIAGANKLPDSAFPWDGLDDRRPRPAFNMRFTDAQLAKLKFVADNTPKMSMHEFCLQCILPALDEQVKELVDKLQNS